MKKKLLVGLLSAFALAGLASCQTEVAPTVKSISATGQDVEFTVGETFNVGDLKVTATMSDGTTQDVTENVTVSENADMSKPGTYAVIISYEGQVFAYQITVSAIDNVATLNNINVVADDAKTYYLLGEELSTTGLVVYETYNNTTTDDTVVAVTDLTGYTVSVSDSEGSKVTGAFAEFGVYTVTVSKGELSDSYSVNVGANVYTSVADALNAGLANSDKVNAGYINIDNDGFVQEYNYAFGNNYTMIVNGTDEYHYELNEDGTVFGVNSYIDYEGLPCVMYIYEPDPANMLGVDLSSVFSYDLNVYGVDELLATLFELATSEEATNYAETFGDACPVCGAHTSYGFSFNYVIGEYSVYEYAFDVEFKLNETTNAIVDVEINLAATAYLYDETTETYVPNPEATEPDFVKTIYINQEIGVRDLVNEHGASVYQFESFDLVDAEDNKYVDGATIDIKVGGKAYLYLSNVTPATALAEVDTITVDVTQNGMDTFSAGGYYDSYEGYVQIYSYKTGTYEVSLHTAKVTYNFTLNVDYAELTDFAPGLYDQYGELYEGYSATVYTNSPYIFSAKVNSNANNAFTATLATETAAATLEADGKDYVFTATEVGEYVINLVSNVDANLISTLTLYVEDAPSAADIINGTYYYDNWGSKVYYVFTPESEGALNGTLVITANGVDYLFDYTYYEAYSTLQVLPANAGASACEWGVGFENYELVCLYYGYFNYGPLTKEGSEVVVEEGTVDNPIVLEAGDYSVNTPFEDFVYCTYTATVDAEIVITVTSASFYYQHGTFNFDLCDMGFNSVLTKSLTAGQTLYFKISTETGQEGVVDFTVEINISVPEGDTPEGAGVSTNPYMLVLGGNYSTYAIISDYVYYAYVAETDITVEMVTTSADFWFEYGVYSFMYCDNVNYTKDTMTISLNAGQTLFVKVATNMLDAGIVSFTFNEASASEGDEEDTPSDAVEIIGGFSPMMATFLDKETTTYVTTVNAGSSAAFGLYGEETGSFFITIEFDANIELKGGSPMMPMTYTSGQVIEVMYDGFLFWFDNSANLTGDVVVTFTVTIY